MEQRDLLDQVLEIAGVRGRLFCQTRASGSWGLSLPRADHASIHVILFGRCFVELGRGKPIELLQGDLALVPHGTGHSLYASPDSARLSLEEWKRHKDESGALVLTRGKAAAESCRMVCGSYRVDAGGPSLLASLPPLIRLTAAELQPRPDLRATLEALTREVTTAGVGSGSIVARLLEVLFVQLLRLWIASADPRDSGWLSALRDPPVRRALGLLHAEPSRAWTLAALAKAAGVSRAVLARRFRAQVGESPLAYLAKLRMNEAADLLRSTELSLKEVTARVGYSSEFAFNRAFKRQHGLAPGAFRRNTRAARGAARAG